MEYQDYKTKLLSLWDWPDDWTFLERLLYCGLGVSGEAGEVAEQVKRILRDDNRGQTYPRTLALIEECGDVLCNLTMLCDELGISFDDIASANLAKLARRKANGTMKGQGSR